MLVTNSDLGCALRAPLPSYRLLSMRFAHDGEQSLQEHIQEALHHHFYLLHDICLLDRAAREHTVSTRPGSRPWQHLLSQRRQEWSSHWLLNTELRSHWHAVSGNLRQGLWGEGGTDLPQLSWYVVAGGLRLTQHHLTPMVLTSGRFNTMYRAEARVLSYMFSLVSLENSGESTTLLMNTLRKWESIHATGCGGSTFTIAEAQWLMLKPVSQSLRGWFSPQGFLLRWGQALLAQLLLSMAASHFQLLKHSCPRSLVHLQDSGLKRLSGAASQRQQGLPPHSALFSATTLWI